MTPTPDNHEKLERLIHRTLRGLPPRRAPHSLQQRVRAEIERRASLPWWRKSFVHWPVPARAGFIVICAALVMLAFTASLGLVGGFEGAQFRTVFAPQFTWIESGLAVVRAITGFFEIMLRNIPPLWIYGGLAIFATMYATVFGLGAAAYKALHTQR